VKRKKTKSSTASEWCKTQYANLVRYQPSGTYYARVRIQGKLIRRSLGTSRISIAKLLLADFEKDERRKATSRTPKLDDRMTFGQATRSYMTRIEGDPTLKPRSKAYYSEILRALLKSWPELESTELRRLTKANCQAWAARFGAQASPSVFNHTLSMLRHSIEVGVEAGVRYDNPARHLKRVAERPKKLLLPEPEQFDSFVAAIAASGSGWSRPCANLVRFLAYGGFRVGEARHIRWQDCDFRRGIISVLGDPETRTKNGEFREVPMIPEMLQLLLQIRSDEPDASPEDPVMGVRECQKAMNRAAARTGMRRITHHDLRHLFATRCIESGVDIPTVSRWLGHKDGGALAMKVYGHLRDHHSTAMAAKVRFRPAPPAAT
jgi:integrase